MLSVLVRGVYRSGDLVKRGVVRVAIVIGAWELCNGSFKDLLILLASIVWRLLDINGVKLVSGVASEAGVNNRVL